MVPETKIGKKEKKNKVRLHHCLNRFSCILDTLFRSNVKVNVVVSVVVIVGFLLLLASMTSMASLSLFMFALVRRVTIEFSISNLAYIIRLSYVPQALLRKCEDEQLSGGLKLKGFLDVEVTLFVSVLSRFHVIVLLS